jgi:RHS repeat-associated protein
LGRVIRFQYCGCGSLSDLIDPLGRDTSWEHDVQGRLIAKHYADGSATSYNYESATSRLGSAVDEKGQFKVYQYYLDDNLQSVSYPNAQNFTPTVAYTYDPNYKRLVSMQDGIGTTLRSYYPVGVLGALQPASVTGPWNNETVTYQYDALGRTTSRAISGMAQSAAFDALGRVTNVVNALGGFSYDYDGATPRLLDAFYPNGQSSHFSYFNNLGDRRLQQITHEKPDASLLSSFSYAYNPVGEITNWVQHLGALTQTWSIGYDAADQLLSVAVSGVNPVNYNYAYDAAANRLLENTKGDQRSFSYDSLNQLLSASDTNAPNLSYQWDAEQRLTGIIQGTNQSQFYYDGIGRRLRIVETSGGVTQADRRFLWCGPDVCEEWNSNNVVVNRYFAQGEQQLGTNLFYTRDHLGSIRELTDSTAANRAEYDYAPYGSPVKLDGNLEVNFGFTGHFRHLPTGLDLTLYRAYDAGNARWLSRDPMKEKCGMNLYGYVQNNPINLVDPLGLCPGDRKKCIEKYIKGMYGNTVAAGINLFAIQPYLNPGGAVEIGASVTVKPKLVEWGLKKSVGFGLDSGWAVMAAEKELFVNAGIKLIHGAGEAMLVPSAIASIWYADADLACPPEEDRSDQGSMVPTVDEKLYDPSTMGQSVIVTEEGVTLVN